MIDKLRLRILNYNDITLFKKWVYEDYIVKWYKDPLSWIHEIENRHGEFNWIHHFIAVLDKKDIGFCQFYEYKQSKKLIILGIASVIQRINSYFWYIPNYTEI